MNIRNNLLKDIKGNYLTELNNLYDTREAEQLLTILIDHFFGIGRNDLILNPKHRLSESEILKLHMAIKELKKFKPVQYITGEVEFQGFRFKVNEDVLIPRPETEELVLQIAKKELDSGLNVLDIGTGSGCIAISLFNLLKNPTVIATDISKPALKVAESNSKLNNANVKFYNHNILIDGYLTDDKMDVIVSNPPYVTLDDKKKMDANVIDYEPHNALFVPEDNPLVFYKRLINLAETLLKQGGRIYAEINESHGYEMEAIFAENNYTSIELLKDIHGKYRFICAVKT